MGAPPATLLAYMQWLSHPCPFFRARGVHDWQPVEEDDPEYGPPTYSEGYRDVCHMYGCRTCGYYRGVAGREHAKFMAASGVATRKSERR